MKLERERERVEMDIRYDDNGDNDESNITNSKIKRKEHEIEIEGLMVKFPFQPYDVQKRFMTATIRAFQKVHILILFSHFL